MPLSGHKDITHLDGTETFNAWQADIRAYLRRNKLWQYVEQEPISSDDRLRSEEAADYITPTLAASVKAKLTDAEFNNGYKMMQKIKEEHRPTGESEFMRLSRQYYTLTYDGTSNMSDFLTQVKLLEERIDATSVKLDNDRRTLLCLTMALQSHDRYRHLTQIWSSSPDMTAEKARGMLLEEARVVEDQAKSSTTALAARMIGGRLRCWFCDRTGHKEDNCFEKYPEKREQWESQMQNSQSLRHVSSAKGKHKQKRLEQVNIASELFPDSDSSE